MNQPTSQSLPSDGFVREPEACRFAGIKRAALWSWVKQGTFPKPHRIGVRAVAWKVGDLRPWAAARQIAQ